MSPDTLTAAERDEVEQAVRRWLDEIVIGLNLCPFARREVDAGRVRVAVTGHRDTEALLLAIHDELQRLQQEPQIATTLLVFANGVADFFDYLDLLDMAQAWLEEQALDTEFQLASFHPDYLFADSPADDAANYTNRAPWPVIHLLREDGVEQAIASHPDTGRIPERNIRLAREKGADWWDAVLRRLRPR
jgi:hypothetical protein